MASTAFLDGRSLVYTGEAPRKVSDYVNRHVGAHGLTLAESRGRAGATLLHCSAGRLDLCQLSYGATARIVSDGLPDIYHVQFILRGRCHYEVDRRILTLDSGQIVLINPNEPIDLTYSADCEKFILKVPRSMFEAACVEHGARRAELRFNPTVPYHFDSVDGFLQLIRLVCQEAESHQATAPMLMHYGRLITAKLITLFEHNVPLDVHGADRDPFSRLEAFIDHHLRDDVSPERLAREANLSVRALYQLFDRRAGTSPGQFVRRRRLEQVYLALSTADPAPSSVTAVALDHGFTHLGRFAEAYRQTFGERPSDTLARRR